MLRFFFLYLILFLVDTTSAYSQEYEHSSLIDWHSVRDKIGNKDVVIRIEREKNILLNGTYIAYVFKKSFSRPYKVKMKELPTIHKSNAYIGQLIDSLSIWFCQSLCKELEGVSTVYYIPAGELFSIPFEYGSLVEGLMFCEKYNFYRITSLNVIGNSRNPSKRNRMLWCGGINYRMVLSKQFEPQYKIAPKLLKLGHLRYSLSNIDEVYSLIDSTDVTILSGEKASENRVKIQMQDSMNVIVFETHGLFLDDYKTPGTRGIEDPMENHVLALAGASYVLEGGIVPDSIDDGILTAREISELDLSHVDLAVVSSCKSALGEIRDDGVYGLMRGFKQAGVKSLIMATDDILDYVAGQLWIQLFRNLSKGMTKREALLEGLKYIRTMDEGAFSHPKYWTPFILIDGME